jgi:hypothetical protein
LTPGYIDWILLALANSVVVAHEQVRKHLESSYMEEKIMSRTFAVAAFLLVVAGCFTDSTNPLFTEKDLVEEDVLVGNWQEKLTVESLGKKTYQLKSRAEVSSGKSEPPIKFWVLKLGDHYFVDFENPKGGHGFTRIAILGDKLYTRSFSDNWLKARFRQFPRELAHRIDREIIQSPNVKPYAIERLVLTAETTDLQSFVLKFINDPTAFGGEPIPAYTKVGRIPIEASGLASKKYRTFNYWYEVRMTLYSVSLPEKAEPKVAAAILEHLSKSISDLPTVGVDLAAVECATDAARVFNSLAAVIRDENDGDRLLEAFVRGLAGDPFGVAMEQIEAQRQIKQQLSSCIQRFDRARVLLTDRYEIEFPSIK